MFSKKDFINYFKQVHAIEKKMDTAIDELLNFIKKEEQIAILKKIKADEMKHIRMLEEISGIIEEKMS